MSTENMIENIQAVLSNGVSMRMQLGECPIWHQQQMALYWIDIDGCAVHRYHPANQSHHSWNMPSEPGCIAFDASGGLLVALRFGLAHLDTDTGVLTTLSDPPYDPSTTRYNDGRCDAAGRFWVGSIYEPRDHPNAALFCISHGDINDSGKRATVSNGLAFSPDNKTMYHSDTTSHRIHAYDFDIASGNITGSRLFKQFSTDKTSNYGGRPDGATVDSQGAYWCAMYEGGRILRLSPEGEILREISLPARCPTMMAFGGEDLKTLYITTVSNKRSAEELQQFPLSGCLLSIRIDVAGLPENQYLT